jgi:hypothetical protein
MGLGSFGKPQVLGVVPDDRRSKQGRERAVRCVRKHVGVHQSAVIGKLLRPYVAKILGNDGARRGATIC